MIENKMMREAMKAYCAEQSRLAQEGSAQALAESSRILAPRIAAQQGCGLLAPLVGLIAWVVGHNRKG